MNGKILLGLLMAWVSLPGCEGSKSKLVSRLRSTSDTASILQGLSSAPQGMLGDSGPTGLQSMQYFIESVSICESLETMGSGFSNPKGCLELYRGPGDARYEVKDLSSNFENLAKVAREDDKNYIDLLDATSRSRLQNTVALREEDARSYQWGIITWYMPIKVRAQVTLSDESSLYTHDGDTVGTTDTPPNSRPFYYYQTTSSKPLTESPAETSVVMLSNGGTWFRFQNPFVVSREELTEGVSFALDLAFNPEGLVKGNQGPVSNRPALVDAAGRAVFVPFLDLSPVPHRSSQKVVREKYVASVQGATPDRQPNSYDVRLELYSLADDENRTIYAASVTTLVNAGTVFGPPEVDKVSFLQTQDTQKLTFQNWAKEAIIYDFERANQLGQETQAKLSCGGQGSMRTFDCLQPGDGSISVTFELRERLEL